MARSVVRARALRPPTIDDRRAARAAACARCGAQHARRARGLQCAPRRALRRRSRAATRRDAHRSEGRVVAGGR